MSVFYDKFVNLDENLVNQQNKTEIVRSKVSLRPAGNGVSEVIKA